MINNREDGDYMKVITSRHKRDDNDGFKSKLDSLPTKHEIFFNIASYARMIGDDKKWVDFFTSCSKNKFELGFKFDGKRYLTFKIKSKIQTFDLLPGEHIPAQHIYDSLKQFIVLYSGYGSDKGTNDNGFGEFANTEKKELIWTNIKSPQIQILIIGVFANEAGKHYGYSNEKIEALSSSLFSCIFTGKLNSDDIHMENGKITSINDLYINEEGFFINRTVSQGKVKNTSHVQNTVPLQMLQQMCMYV